MQAVGRGPGTAFPGGFARRQDLTRFTHNVLYMFRRSLTLCIGLNRRRDGGHLTPSTAILGGGWSVAEGVAPRIELGRAAWATEVELVAAGFHAYPYVVADPLVCCAGL